MGRKRQIENDSHIIEHKKQRITRASQRQARRNRQDSSQAWEQETSKTNSHTPKHPSTHHEALDGSTPPQLSPLKPYSTCSSQQQETKQLTPTCSQDAVSTATQFVRISRSCEYELDRAFTLLHHLFHVPNSDLTRIKRDAFALEIPTDFVKYTCMLLRDVEKKAHQFYHHIEMEMHGHPLTQETYQELHEKIMSELDPCYAGPTEEESEKTATSKRSRKSQDSNENLTKKPKLNAQTRTSPRKKVQS